MDHQWVTRYWSGQPELPKTFCVLCHLPKTKPIWQRACNGTRQPQLLRPTRSRKYIDMGREARNARLDLGT